jgi:hypothetical protein
MVTFPDFSAIYSHAPLAIGLENYLHVHPKPCATVNTNICEDVRSVCHFGSLKRRNDPGPSHANEEATRNGKVLPGTRTETFLKATKMPVHVPLSGKTMEFDSAGSCIAGC